MFTKLPTVAEYHCNTLAAVVPKVTWALFVGDTMLRPRIVKKFGEVSTIFVPTTVILTFAVVEGRLNCPGRIRLGVKRALNTPNDSNSLVVTGGTNAMSNWTVPPGGFLTQEIELVPANSHRGVPGTRSPNGDNNWTPVTPKGSLLANNPGTLTASIRTTTEAEGGPATTQGTILVTTAPAELLVFTTFVAIGTQLVRVPSEQ